VQNLKEVIQSRHNEVSALMSTEENAIKQTQQDLII